MYLKCLILLIEAIGKNLIPPEEIRSLKNTNGSSERTVIILKTDEEKMYFTQEKLRRDIRDIAKYRYIDKMEITDFEVCEDAHPEVTNAVCPTDAQWHQGQKGEIWNGYDRYRWVRFTLNIPADTDFNSENGVHLLYIDGSLHAPGYKGEFEGTVFLNGQPYQGVDHNHKEVFLGKEFAGRTLKVMIRLWSGMSYDNGPYTMIRQFTEMTFCRLDKKVDELYYDALNLLDAVEMLPNTSSHALDYIHALKSALGKIEWPYAVKENPAPFFDSLHEAHDLLRQTYNRFQKHEDVTVHVFGQTHIDVAWLWRVKHAREKSARSFSTVLRYMERYPDYTFFQSQPQLYSFVKKDFPKEYEQIKKRVLEGRWDADGAMWLESDCNLTSGESLVRQILYGKRFFQQEFGIDSHVVWLPDTFGFNAALPQILKKSGITAFATSKMCWSDYNRMPHDTFYWKGIDGSRILTCFVTTPVLKEYDSFGTTCNGVLTAKTVWGAWDHYREKELSKDVFMCYGFGDGGGGPTRDMIESKNRIKKIPGFPNVKDDGLTNYCDLMNRKMEQAENVPEWSGELYLENHRGTYTSQSLVKKSNRKMEYLLRRIETVQTAAALENGAWDSESLQKLNDVWHTALLNQFHDILPGSAVGPVYQDAHAAYQTAFETAGKVLQKAESALPRAEGATFSVLNSLGIPATDLVEIETSAPQQSFQINQEPVLFQKTEKGYLIECPKLAPLAYTPVYAKQEKTPQNSHKVLSEKDGVYETPFYRFRMDEGGRLASLYDLQAKRDVLAPDGLGNLLQSYDDRPLCYDAWNIDVFYQDHSYPVNGLKSLQVVENGSLRAKIRIIWHHFDSEITQDITFYKSSRRIDFKTRVNWQERHQLLRVSFAVNVHSEKAAYDIPFGNIERPTHTNTSWDFARYEVCAHKWEDLSENDYGVSLMNDCKYGCSVKGNVFSLSLLKSAASPDPKADEGIHEFSYSLLPHIGGWKEADIESIAYQFNNPVIVSPSPVKSGSLFQANQGIEIDAVKKCEDDNCVILRLHEYLGKHQNLAIHSDYSIAKWCETDLMENGITPASETSVIQTAITPYEIKTFKVWFQN